MFLSFSQHLFLLNTVFFPTSLTSLLFCLGFMFLQLFLGGGGSFDLHYHGVGCFGSSVQLKFGTREFHGKSEGWTDMEACRFGKERENTRDGRYPVHEQQIPCTLLSHIR
ncbi:hypothetical protein QBC33DRAFT_527551 [Phialemonium atrogriseum]|uniref:Uncharacterized protein n=1 Tax=Phialemonium atrogriseum TaxID=1093897 RepID=A0AAJ0C5G5_9PEZI|nr:uncharacterized protein QBC33DRAFT_527551 [Phialemonium atrogriseum]KAK1770311.1 hypothetical protein QBC33DRAFT_527551 [Phialemonium atrogriseum]